MTTKKTITIDGWAVVGKEGMPRDFSISFNSDYMAIYKFCLQAGLEPIDLDYRRVFNEYAEGKGLTVKPVQITYQVDEGDSE